MSRRVSGCSDSELTLGAWLDRVDDRGWGDETVWHDALRCARAALRAVRCWLRRFDADDLVQDVVLLARTPPEGWRRPTRRDVPLVNWFAGVLRKRCCARARATPTPIGDAIHAVEAPDHDDEAPIDPVAAERLEHVRELHPERLLTRKQLESWNLYVKGTGSREAAEQLGISREAHRDRVKRARAHLRTGTPAPRGRAPGWLVVATRLAEASGATEDERLLSLRRLGRSYAACAEALGSTLAAVTSRLARIWTRARDRLAEGACDSDLPSPPCRGRGRSLHGGGSDDGTHAAPLEVRADVRAAEAPRGGRACGGRVMGPDPTDP
jgi:DNA-directed RNA polymerase specialized sigma24 family protein